MLVDLVLFNDEVELLAFRLKYLSPVVEKFVIFEATRSFSGKAKKLFASEAVQLSEVSKDKVIISKYEFPAELLIHAGSNRWPLERFARSRLEVFCSKFPQDTRLLISDLDEIPSISQLIEAQDNHEVTLLPTPLFYRSANWAVSHGEDWKTAKVVPKEFLNDVNTLRYRDDFQISNSEPGGHFSYLGSTDLELFKKLEDIAHAEFSIPKSEVTVILKYSNKYFLDHLGRFNRKGFGLLNKIEPHELSSLQRALLEFNPAFFEFEVEILPLPQRLFASFKLWVAWRSKDFKILEANFRGRLALQFVTYTSKFWVLNTLLSFRGFISQLIGLFSRR